MTEAPACSSTISNTPLSIPLDTHPAIPHIHTMSSATLTPATLNEISTTALNLAAAGSLTLANLLIEADAPAELVMAYWNGDYEVL